MSKSKPRKSHSKEFKIEAAKMVVELGSTQAEVARNLGVTSGQVHRWVTDYKADPEHAFPGKGHLSPADERTRQLEAQVRRLTMERDILKKAMAYFAEVPK